MDMSTCANCGKGESEESCSNLKTCVACKMVKYCNAACQTAHRPQHKRECKQRAMELHEEALFKIPLPNEECPICFLPLPSMTSGKRFKSCCGKMICSGCIHAAGLIKELCPFCRARDCATPRGVELQVKKRAEKGDANAIFSQACGYEHGMYGLQQDQAKAIRLYHKAAELGCPSAYNNMANMYMTGQGVERDTKKTKQYYEHAAMGGMAVARYSLGRLEGRAGNTKRALKHYMIGVKGGSEESLNEVKEFCMRGLATKEDYAQALQSYQAYLDEIKSEERDKAAGATEFGDQYRYH